MSQIPTFTPGTAAAKPTFAAAAAGDTARIGDNLVVKNGSVSSVTVTITTPGTLTSGDAYPDKAYIIAASDEIWVRMISDYADPTDGLAHISYSATTSVTRAVIAG